MEAKVKCKSSNTTVMEELPMFPSEEDWQPRLLRLYKWQAKNQLAKYRPLHSYLIRSACVWRSTRSTRPTLELLADCSCAICSLRLISRRGGPATLAHHHGTGCTTSFVNQPLCLLRRPVVRHAAEQLTLAADLRGIGESSLFHQRDDVRRRIVLQMMARMQKTPDEPLLVVFR